MPRTAGTGIQNRGGRRVAKRWKTFNRSGHRPPVNLMHEKSGPATRNRIAFLWIDGMKDLKAETY